VGRLIAAFPKVNLDSGEETPPSSREEMIPEYVVEFLLIVGGARLVWMGHTPKPV
jgi:hypothetical protein